MMYAQMPCRGLKDITHVALRLLLSAVLVVLGKAFYSMCCRIGYKGACRDFRLVQGVGIDLAQKVFGCPVRQVLVMINPRWLQFWIVRASVIARVIGHEMHS
jgi:hypothetical protein